MPRISVLLPVFNAGRYLPSALDSILGQTERYFELIAVNDGSTDNSGRILKDYAAADKRLHYVHQENSGIGVTLNRAIALSKGEFLARMDADDVADKTRFALQLSRFEDEPELVALGTSVTFMDSAGNLVETCRRSERHVEIEQGLLKGDGGMMIHPSVMFRRSAIEKVGGYSNERFLEDLDIYLKLARVGRLANLPASLLCYRIHPSSLNYTNCAERRALRTRILSRAHAERGLPFDPLSVPDEPSAGIISNKHRDWAMSALQFGGRRVAVKYGWLACWRSPWKLSSWKALKYSLTAPVSGASSDIQPFRARDADHLYFF